MNYSISETELYPPMIEGWFFAVWGGYSEASGLSSRLLVNAVPVRITVLLPEQLN